ncbi:hypothetical protein SteCoe_20819 [Stentor coeruleus]|uniref:Uncharacterized protein n=1 Tax=Stentor coeruleus TaxID=5963 RepID=A0A1R2BR54_9CILI|nr:hypothetical protein SteCoe_20819 [Stentor coeruleus]
MDEQTTKRKKSVKRQFEFSNDIFERYRRIRRKIDALRAKKRLQEAFKSSPIPKINEHSRKILKSPKKLKPFSPSRLQKTQNIIKNSRFMPKSIKISLVSLMTPIKKSSIATERLSSNSISISSSRAGTSSFYPSLVRPSRLKKCESDSFLPNDIESRNKLLFNLREKASFRGFLTEPQEPPEGKSIHERTQRWLIRKKNRLESERKSKEDKSLSICTFKPKLISKKFYSMIKTSRTQSSEGSNIDIRSRNRLSKAFTQNSKSVSTLSCLIKPTSTSSANSPRSFLYEKPYFAITPYEKITPIKMDVGYKHGFTQRLKVKSQPMLNYSKIHLKTS